MVLFGSLDHPTQFQTNFALLEIAALLFLMAVRLPNG